VRGYLVLENGKVFAGTRFGASGDVMAEIVFTTGMTGYLETLTDKSYAGQMVVQTFPLIGNYGVIPSDFEGNEIGPCAYIVKEWCQIPSNFRSEGNLDTFFSAKNLVALSGIDTRTLTQIIRDAGRMNACITDDPDSVDVEALKAYRVSAQVAKVSTKEAYTAHIDDEKYQVALLDLGVKNSLVGELVERGCTVTVLPHDTSAEDILAAKPNGIVLSGGPGNPEECGELVETVKTLTQAGVPILGIGLGHHLLAMAHGFAITRLPHGHRGSNQPIRDTQTGRVYLTAQNHDYAVERAEIPGAEVRFEHVNDLSVEGIRYTEIPAFSVQFQPESGPWDTRFLFDEFTMMMEG